MHEQKVMKRLGYGDFLRIEYLNYWADLRVNYDAMLANQNQVNEIYAIGDLNVLALVVRVLAAMNVHQQRMAMYRNHRNVYTSLASRGVLAFEGNFFECAP